MRDSKAKKFKKTKIVLNVIYDVPFYGLLLFYAAFAICAVSLLIVQAVNKFLGL